MSSTPPEPQSNRVTLSASHREALTRALGVRQGWHIAQLERPLAQRPVGTMLMLFFVAFTSLQAAWLMARGTVIERAVVDDATVRPAAALINLLLPASHAKAQGPRIDAARGGLRVELGCEGTEVLFLLLAALAAYPLSGGARLRGMLLSLLLVYGLNQGRLVALFWAVQHDRARFAALHDFIGPALLVSIAALFFAYWIRPLPAARAR